MVKLRLLLSFIFPIAIGTFIFPPIAIGAIGIFIFPFVLLHPIGNKQIDSVLIVVVPAGRKD